MRNCRNSLPVLVFLAGAWPLLAPSVMSAQAPDLGPILGGDQNNPGLSLDVGGGVLGEGDRVPKFDAGFTRPGPDGTVQLFISATLPPGSHTYSITQPPGGPLATRITVDRSAEANIIGKFQPVERPHIEHDEDAFPGLPLETHSSNVKWVATIRFVPGAQPERIKIQGKVNVQLCDAKGCVQPKDYPFTATLRADVPAVPVTAVNTKGNPGTAPPTAPPRPVTVPPTTPATIPPTSANNTVPPATAPSKESSPPANTAKSPRVSPPGAVTRTGEIEWLPFTDVTDLRQMVNSQAFDVDKIREHVREENSRLGILGAILAGFLGGLILNVMPCVLPVIGLKIVSFVEQSGHNRGKAFMLNAWYSLGLLTVFLLLATLAVVLHFGWGELFGKSWFTITLAAVVFVMSLNFMGVWELPLPAFLGSGKTGELARQEGVVGAYFKGVLTTFLATPCSAPLFAPAVAWATSQPAVYTFSIFISAALGMASPYLLVGAMPELLRFLPKPGAWMETFKQFMGFVLMGTVVYLLAILKPYYVVPTVGLLFGLSFMCWWTGRISPLADVMSRLRAWSQGALVVCVAWIVMFPGLNHSALGPLSFSGLAVSLERDYAPPPTSNAAAPRIVGPKTVLVDFTADWCPNCHAFERTVLNTQPVIDKLRQLGVVTLKADWSQDSPDVSAMLDILGSRQIPVIAVFSHSDPNHPAVFRGGYTQKDLLDALEKAGPSPGASG
jgi:suppressor for copper-sensitivity B